VQWAGPPGATYTLEYSTPATGVVNVPAPGAAALASTGQYPGDAGPALPLGQTTVFTLDVAYTAGGATYSAQRQATVVVVPPAPVITRFDGQLGGTLDSPVLTLTWATENADGCQLTGTSEQLDAQGTRPLPNPVDTGAILPVYTLTANGAPGLTTTLVFDTPPRITRFTGTAVESEAGMQLRLAWETWLGGTCTITGVPGGLPASGSVLVTPTAQQPLASEYTLTARARGKTDTSTLSPGWSGQPAAQQTLPMGGVAASPLFPMAARQTLPMGAVAASPIFPMVAFVTPGGGMIATPDERVIVTVPQAVSLFSASSLQPLAPPSMPLAPPPILVAPFGGGTGGIAINPAGTRVFIASGAALAAYDTQTFQPVPASAVPIPIPVPITPSVGAGVAVASTGDRVFVCSDQTTSVAVLNADTLQLMGAFQLPEPATAVAATPDGRHLVFAATAALYLVDPQSYGPSAPPIPIPAPSGSGQAVAVTPDSALALLSTGSGVSSVNLQSGAVQPVPVATVPASAPAPGPLSGLWVGGLTVSPDGWGLYAMIVGSSFSLNEGVTSILYPSLFLRTTMSGGVGG
jgi:hypothetical protein